MVRFVQRPSKLMGLSLIEVLIALAIVSIALAAVMKTVVQNIQATNYLQDKTIATWVGQTVLNEARVGLLTLSTGDELKQSTLFLGRQWYWEAKAEQTANPRIQKISVQVGATGGRPLVNLESYKYDKI